MPPSGYLSSVGIEACIQYITSTYPAISQLITLPEQSVQGRTIRALKIGTGGGSHRHGLLLIGGVHARELVPPDALVTLAIRLCQAYTGNTGLTYGGRTYAPGTVKLIVEGLDLFILPLVNPDGRTFVQAPTGDFNWRKNRRPNPGGCFGVDINRNYDFLWSSGIGTSSNPCEYQVYKGPAPFSEPETRNVRWMLDTYANIECMVDVHSYSELILYPWGDDDNQTTDPAMNFQNPAYNGLRGNPGDSIYREYIPAHDRDWFVNSGTQVRSAISAVRGRTYLLEQGVGLYPTSGTSDDYAYGRHFVDSAKERVYAYVIEVGSGAAGGFQPQYSEALQQIAEVSSGLVQYAIQCLCAVETTGRLTKKKKGFAEFDKWKGKLEESAAGRRYLELIPVVSAALLPLLADDRFIREDAGTLLEGIGEAVEANPEDPRIDGDLVGRATKLLDRLEKAGGRDVAAAVQELKADAKLYRNKPLREGLEAAGKRLQSSKGSAR